VRKPPERSVLHSALPRRRFLAGIGTAAIRFGVAPLTVTVRTDPKHLPKPKNSGVEHIVVVTMENRSFDHLLGWLPGADGKQEGLSFLDSAGVSHPTHALAPDFQGCGRSDPDHSFEGGRIEFDNGRCDGWLRAGQNDDYAVGYYTQRDLEFLGLAAPTWTTCDQYFAAIMAETFPNRIYQHAAQTDRIDNTVALSTLPTIWDRLAAAGIEGRYYYTDIPMLGLWGAKYLPISEPVAAFFSACASDTLPAVSVVDPGFLGEDEGISNDDHPHADIRRGEVFLHQVYTAVTTGSAWRNTVLVITYDEWGGFFDHVPPPTVQVSEAEQGVGNTDGRLGFRVPCVIVSPFARRAYVASTPFDHTSILRFIEWRWDLDPLTVRDAAANNLAEELDFNGPVRAAPALPPPPGQFALPCAGTFPATEWLDLRDLARTFGWPL
jgi:phospholipase C